MMAYGTGLRLTELCHLRVEHIDSHADRMCIRVVQGKGAKDRYVPLAPDVLEVCVRGGEPPPRRSGCSRAARDPAQPMDVKSAQRWYRASRAQGRHHQARRHPHAATLLMPRTCWKPACDLYSLQQWLGHGHVSTTTRYLHLARPDVPDGAAARAAGAAAARCRRSRRTEPSWAPAGRGAAALRARLSAQHALSTAQARAWRAIVSCRTPALGGELLRCDGCGAQAVAIALLQEPALPAVPDAPARCLARRAAGRVAGCAVLPPGLHAAARDQRAGAVHARWVYDTLMQCTAATLTEFAANPRWLGGIGAFTLVLHTWTRTCGATSMCMR